MTGPATSPIDILNFLIDCAHSGRGGVLVTLVGIEGSSPRAMGSQLAVASSGEYAGSLSGGCIEAAVAAEAVEALRSESPRIVRYGIGSPYLDIRLPCGGGIDLLFTPRPRLDVLRRTVELLESRRAASLTLDDKMVPSEAAVPSGWHNGKFTVTYTPPLRIRAFGQGEELTATTKLAHAFGARTESYSPYRRDLKSLADQGIAATHLEFRDAIPSTQSDLWTAIIFLFHDRDWEEALLPWALGLPRFYIGALGSRASQAARVAMLEAANVSPTDIQSLRSPVGLIPSTRDPATLALSILAEIAESFMSDANLPLAKAQMLAAQTQASSTTNLKRILQG